MPAVYTEKDIGSKVKVADTKLRYVATRTHARTHARTHTHTRTHAACMSFCYQTTTSAPPAYSRNHNLGYIAK